MSLLANGCIAASIVLKHIDQSLHAMLEHHNIVGERIWWLYRDVAGEDISTMLSILRGIADTSAYETVIAKTGRRANVLAYLNHLSKLRKH